MTTVQQLIARHHSEIMRSWTEAIGRTAASRGLTPTELSDTMPAYLSLLGQTAADSSSLPAPQTALIERHLSSRLRQGFVLNEILTELAVLGRCVARVIDGEPVDSRPSVSDVARMFVEIHLTSLVASRLFNEHLLEDEQTEKRCARMVQKIVGDQTGIHPASVAWKERLGEILEVIMQAMGAHTAALLLFDAVRDELVMSASTGVADEVLERHVSSLDPSTFAGRIATRAGQATTMDDVATTELTVSESLRRSGIHSLLGVRLCARHALRGVIYIGVRDRRAFTASEIRRLEGLGDTLAIQLDNAQLNATLRQHVGQLEAEAKLRERFVSVLMHDLQAPLAAARERARRLVDAVDLASAAADIAHELDHLQRMVGGLVDVQRIRAGRPLELVIEDCDLSSIARGVVEELRRSHADRAVFHGARGVRGMWSPEVVRRAIRNLVLNGLEHGLAGGEVIVTVRRETDGALVAVHDAGPSIPAELQAELFKPFAGEGGSIHAPPRGWGLGLTLVWGCAEAHGGRVSVESLPDEGTTFSLLLPYDARPYVD